MTMFRNRAADFQPGQRRPGALLCRLRLAVVVGPATSFIASIGLWDNEPEPARRSPDVVESGVPKENLSFPSLSSAIFCRARYTFSTRCGTSIADILFEET